MVQNNSAIADEPRDAFVQCAIAWLTPPPPFNPLKHVRPHICYHAEFGHSRSNRVCINGENPLNSSRWRHASLGWRVLTY